MFHSNSRGVNRASRPPDGRPPSAPRWLRRTAVLTSVSFLWTALFATPLQVAAQMPQKPAFGPPKPIPAPAVHDDPAWHTIDYHAQEHARPAVARRTAPAPLTLLDEVGRLAQPITHCSIIQ